MANIYDLAYDLEKGLRNSEEFNGLKEAYERVMNNPDSKEKFDLFRDTQLNLQQKQMQGEDISEAEVEEARKVVEEVQQNEDISKLMDQEQRLNTVIQDISKIITQPLEELYGDEE